MNKTNIIPKNWHKSSGLGERI